MPSITVSFVPNATSPAPRVQLVSDTAIVGEVDSVGVDKLGRIFYGVLWDDPKKANINPVMESDLEAEGAS